MYSSDLSVELDPAQVVEVAETQTSLFLRGKFWVTKVRLQDGTEHLLEGRVKDQVLRAMQSAQSETSTAAP